jgi:hypothetical protein
MTEVRPELDLTAVRRMVTCLEELLNLVYPPPANVDIITLEDMQHRYRLTGFGIPAITAIQQSQRILRASKDYVQIGLSAFHTGLIYLYWGQCLGAAQHFAEARRQWRFVDATSSICLSFFAEGTALHQVLHFEPAMGCYGQVEQWLPRLKLTTPSANLDQYIIKLNEVLAAALRDLRQRMWPRDEEIGTTGEEREVSSPPPPGVETEAEREEEERERPSTPPPRAHIIQEQPTPPVTTDESISRNDLSIPAPIIQARAEGPTAAFKLTAAYYTWYQVEYRLGDFLPTVQKDTWLLVDTRPRPLYKKDDLLVIGSNHTTVGSITIRSQNSTQGSRIYLLAQSLDDQRPFTRDESGAVTIGKSQIKMLVETGFGPLETDDLWGVVIGCWINAVPLAVD